MSKKERKERTVYDTSQLTPAKAQEFHTLLLDHLHLSPAEFVLKYRSQKTWPVQRLAQQLNGLQRAQKKLPTWFNTPSILYPPNVNLEQTSSEATARYKASLVSGHLSADLTGGFGIDSFYLSQQVEAHHYLEQNAGLFEITASNYKTLGRSSIHCHPTDAQSWLTQQSTHFDWLYCDPSRRQGASKKFLLKDCEPNLEALLPLMRAKADRVLLKLSPLIDLKALIAQLGPPQAIHVVSVKNECKEVLVVMGEDVENPIITTVNLDATGTVADRFDFSFEEENNSQVELGTIDNYVYEPNTSILKAGAYKTIAARFDVKKLHTNTHLYTSKHYVEKWPGRTFQITDGSTTAAHIISRNHPLSTRQLQQQYHLQPGKDRQYLIAFTDLEKPKITYARRIK